MQQEKTFFKTELAYENWKSKYKYKDETPLQTFERVAKALASVEKKEEQQNWYNVFRKTIIKFDEQGNPIGLKCTPGGRITANAGTEFNGATLLNCYINGPITSAKIEYSRKSFDNKINYNVKIKSEESPDNLINIFLAILEQAKTLAAEGGYGINFSFIRPRGTVINSIGIKHPGVVSYMQIWDAVSECIVKGDNDGYKDKIQNYLNDEQSEELKKNIKAMARKGAMLGALNCFSENTEILTNIGWLKITDIIEKVKNNELLYAISENNCENKIINPIIKEKTQIYEIETESGEKLEVTENHEIEVKNIKTNEIYLKRIDEIDPLLEEIKIIICE